MPMPGESDVVPAEQGSLAAARSEREAAMNLFFAVAEGDVEVTKALLAGRVNPNCRDYEARCPMHVAAGQGACKAILEALLLYRADVNPADYWGQTPLDLAKIGEHFNVEELLKSNGGKLNRQTMDKKANREKWSVERSEVLLGPELNRTLKSVVNKASWCGVDVVAKFCLPCHEKAPDDLEDEMLHEISILATLRHPDLVMFLGCCIQESPIMIITQFMQMGDLEHYYRVHGKDSTAWTPGLRTISPWARAVARALTFLHHCSSPVIHRDLKPLNLLLNESLEVKVSDFGISTMTQKRLPNWVSTDHKVFGDTTNSSPEDKLTGGVGTWRYMAPEITRYEKYDVKADIYSFALILYFMSSGRQPFHEFGHPVLVLNEYAKGKEPRPKSAECPAVLRPIMEAAWAVDAARRPDASELVEMLADINAPKCGCTAM